MKRAVLAAVAVTATAGVVTTAPLGEPRVACTVLLPDGGYAERVEVGGKVGRLCHELGRATLLTPKLEETSGSCACWAPDAGACDDTLGRTRGFNEAQPGTWSGPGCVPKSCGQFAGHPNWPPECPQ